MTEDRTISLNAVKEMIKGMPDWSITKNAFAYRINVEDLMKGLEDLPPVTPTDEEMAMQYQRGYIDGFKEGKSTFEPKTGHWIMKHRNINKIEYHTGEDVLNDEIHTVKELIRYETDDPYCSECGKRTDDIAQDFCGYCGAKMERSDKE